MYASLQKNTEINELMIFHMYDLRDVLVTTPNTNPSPPRSSLMRLVNQEYALNLFLTRIFGSFSYS